VTEGESLTSTIFLVPRSWSGRNLLYLEYFPMNNEEITEFNQIANTTGRIVTNNGLYMMAVRSDGFCDQILVAAQMRMMLDARFLAARVDSISYNSYVGYRDWDPGRSSFYGGGTSYFNGYGSAFQQP
jgi:uncharacterized membrane protein YgcG